MSWVEVGDSAFKQVRQLIYVSAKLTLVSNHDISLLNGRAMLGTAWLYYRREQWKRETRPVGTESICGGTSNVI